MVNYNIYPKSIKDNLQIISTNSNIKYYDYKAEENTYNLNTDGTTLLNTVVLKARVKSKESVKKPLIKMYGAKYINLVESDFQQLPISSIIRNNGFDVVTSVDNVTIRTRRIVPGGTAVPSVYIDNMPLFDNFKSLASLRVSDVEDMYISRTPNPGDSPAGTIKIFTRNGEGVSTPKNKYQSKDNLFGFSIPKEYYSPNYLNTNSGTFLKLGAIHWVPNLIPNEKGELTWKLHLKPNETNKLLVSYTISYPKGKNLSGL